MHTTTSKFWAEATRLANSRPLHAVGVAAAAGYLMGGGLLSPLTRRLLALGVRFKLHRLLQRLDDTQATADMQKAEP